MGDITKIKVNGGPESSYQLYPRNEEFAKRAGGNAGSQSGVQSDWNQNDATKPDYVKNRPFYTGAPVETVIIEESTAGPFLDAGDNLYAADCPLKFSAKIGETYKVYWDGTVYECTCVSVNDLPTIGNPSIQGDGSDTGEPFCIVVFSNSILIYTADTSAYHTFSISKLIPGEVIKIDKKYLPTLEYIIPSSTSGSTKKFKITVDDSGALTATEVT